MTTKIPLTIEHSKEDIPFFTMPEANLGGLLDIEFDKLCNRQIKLDRDWIKNKRCKCSQHPDILNKRLVLSCKHFEKCLREDKICKECDRKIERMSSALIIRNLIKFKIKQKGGLNSSQP